MKQSFRSTIDDMSKAKPSKKVKSHGGARAKSGRKPVTDKKVGFTIYVEQSILNGNGDMDETRRDCYEFLKNRAQEKSGGE